MNSFLRYNLICFVFIACLAHRISATPKSIQLGSTPTTQVHSSGPFSIIWNGEQKSLTVVHQADPSKVLWSSKLGKGFVGAATATAVIEESSGHFYVRDTELILADSQTITSITADNGEVIVSGDLYVRGAAMSLTYTLVLREGLEDQLDFTLRNGDENFNRLFLQYQSSAEEQFFGFGMQCSYFNHKGNLVPVLVNEQGIGRGDIKDPLVNLVLGSRTGDDYTSYVAVPHYISSELRSVYLKNYGYTEFDLTDSTAVQIKAFEPELSGSIIYGEDPAQLLKSYTGYAGRMRTLPDWIIRGAVIGLQGGTQKVYQVWNQLKSVSTPVSGFWLQDWIGQRVTLVGKQLWWNWELDADRYPSWDTLYDSLRLSNIKILGYINSFIADIVQERPGMRRNLFKEAMDNGFLVNNENGSPYLIQNTSFFAAVLDLSNPACEAWIKDIIKDELIARGQWGWMADFGEAMPMDGTIFSGEDAKIFHNKYPEEWARINREAIEEADYGDSIVFFMRSGFTRSPKYSTLFWLGDQMTSWGPNDGIKSAVTGLLSGGMSGFSLNHSDIGGYATITYPIVTRIKRSPELLRRWAEMNAFSVVYRTHEGLNPDENHQFYKSQESLEHFARYAKIYEAWYFYRKQLVAEAAETGMPVVRHPFMHYYNDPEVFDLSYQQFMVGTELMVAPVLDRSKTEASIYLPAGNWVDLWTGEVRNSSGQSFLITGLTDRPAVFFPQGSVVGEQFRSNLISAGLL